jgi:hypothetical protein
MTLRLMGATALAVWIAGATPLAGEARTHDTSNRRTKETLTILPASRTHHLRWQANVQTEGGAFRLFSGQKKAEMRLIGEIEARSGQHSYRFRQVSPSTYTVDCRIHHYELRFLPEGGDEVSLASIIILEENAAPATTVEDYSPERLASLSSSTFQHEHQRRMPKVGRRPLPDSPSRHQPPPPP